MERIESYKPLIAVKASKEVGDQTTQSRKFFSLIVTSDLQLNVTLAEKYRPGKHYKHELRNNMQQESTKFRSNFIDRYLKDSSIPADSSSWLSAPEFPTPEEVQDITAQWQTVDPSDGSIVLRGNELEHAWGSREEYLQAHFEMLREETVRPLREAVSWVLNNPDSREDQLSFGGNIGIYEKVGAIRPLRYNHLTSTTL
jgi:hypothetical protein